jgi:hypothetical protein
MIHAHKGGGCPCDPDELVVVKFRNGRLCGKLERDGEPFTPVEAGKLRWSSWGQPADFDVVQWRRA